GVGVNREGFLGLAAIIPQAGDGSDGRGIDRIKLLPGGADGLDDVGEDGFVKVDTAESFHAFRFADLLETAGGLPRERSIKGAATEVVDSDNLARFNPFANGVVHCSSDWFGDETNL